jgi:hypothetical protein
LELAAHTSDPAEKSNLIAKALLAHPSEQTLVRLGDIVHGATCASSDQGLARNVNSREALVGELKEKELQVAALLQRIAQT